MHAPRGEAFHPTLSFHPSRFQKKRVAIARMKTRAESGCCDKTRDYCAYFVCTVFAGGYSEKSGPRCANRQGDAPFHSYFSWAEKLN